MNESLRITIAKNGPYLAYGHIPLSTETIATNAGGESTGWEAGPQIQTSDTYALCRCGHSAEKPFCDGTHASVGFDGTETASTEPFEEAAKELPGPAMALYDHERLCAFARFCDSPDRIWTLIEQTGDTGVRRVVTEQAGNCPSGRLVVHSLESGTVIEPEFQPALILVEDPAKECSGPIWARGHIRITSADGHDYERRNRITLCRCGASQNKPFCDGTHADIAFKG